MAEGLDVDFSLVVGLQQAVYSVALLTTLRKNQNKDTRDQLWYWVSSIHEPFLSLGLKGGKVNMFSHKGGFSLETRFCFGVQALRCWLILFIIANLVITTLWAKEKQPVLDMLDYFFFSWHYVPKIIIKQ